MTILPNLQNYRILLASNSPRRKELLGGLNIPFEVRLIDDIDESYPDDLAIDSIAEHIALKKAEAYIATLAENELLITADTIVGCDDKVLGKPSDKEDAVKMLLTLSGRTHEVITGVCVVTQQKKISFSGKSDVSFASLTEDEVRFYVDRYQPLDKAGAYGIQEWIGYIGVKAIHGSFYNVMGLPIQMLYQELKNFE